MKPAPEILWPTADEIARVIVAASRSQGEDPIAVAEGRPISRARIYALVALAHRFPGPSHRQLLTKLGVEPDRAEQAAVHAAQVARKDSSKSAQWFDLDTLNLIVKEVGWPPMSQNDSHIRRVNSKKNPATARNWALKAQALTAASGMPGLAGVTVPAPVYPGSFSAPDAPIAAAESNQSRFARDVNIRTAELCGDPKPGRSALDQRIADQTSKGERRNVYLAG